MTERIYRPVFRLLFILTASIWAYALSCDLTYFWIGRKRVLRRVCSVGDPRVRGRDRFGNIRAWVRWEHYLNVCGPVESKGVI